MKFLIVALISMSPISELRGGIPTAVFAYKISPLIAYIFCAAANIVPAVILVYSLNWLERFFSSHWLWAKRTLDKIYAKTKKKMSRKFEIYGFIALTLFVAIPLPITGVWTGAIAANIFGVKPKYAIPSLALGVAIAGIIVLTASLGIKVSVR